MFNPIGKEKRNIWDCSFDQSFLSRDLPPTKDARDRNVASKTIGSLSTIPSRRHRRTKYILSCARNLFKNLTHRTIGTEQKVQEWKKQRPWAKRSMTSDTSTADSRSFTVNELQTGIHSQTVVEEEEEDRD